MRVLTAFDPALVPHGDIQDFLYWYDMTTEWVEDRDYDSIEGTSKPLAQWYQDLSAEFAPVVDGATGTTRYIIGSDCVYARFADHYADEAFERARAVASRLGLGTYEAGSGQFQLADGTIVS